METTKKKGRGRPKKKCDNYEYLIMQLRVPKELIEEVDAVMALAKDRMFGIKDNRQSFMLRAIIQICEMKRKEFAANDRLRRP